MRTFTTRLISAALAAGMMLSILPASAFAAGNDTGGGKYSSPDTVSAQTLDMQNDDSVESGTGTEADPIVIKMNDDGTPAGSSGTGWEYNYSALSLTGNHYYAFDPAKKVNCFIALGDMTSFTPSGAHIVKGIFSNTVTLLTGKEGGPYSIIDGGLYTTTVATDTYYQVTGGIFTSSLQHADTTHSVTATDCTITAGYAGENGYTTEFPGNKIYAVNPATHTYTVSIKYNGDTAKLGGWSVTIGNDSSKKLSDLTDLAVTGTNGSNIPTLFSFTMPGDADVTLTPLLSAELKIAADGYPEGTTGGEDSVEYVNWAYSKADGLTLKSGNFVFDSKTVIKCPVSLESSATLNGGTFTETVTNEKGGKIYGGVFVKNKPKQSAYDDYAHQMKPFTIDDTDCTSYSVNGVQLTSDTFYFCVGNDEQNIQVVYTGASAAAIKGWQVTENSTTENVAPGDSFINYSNGPFIATVQQDNAAVLDVCAYDPHLIGDSFKLKALTDRPLAKSEMKVYLKQKGSADKTLLQPGASVDPWPEFPYAEQGYEMIIEPDGHIKDIDVSYNTKTEILDAGTYRVTVEFDKTEEHLGAEKMYYFKIVEPTYSVTVEGSGRARYQYGSSAPVGDTKVEKGTYIVLESTVAPDAEYPFLRWEFDKTDDITFTSETGAELSADAVDLTKDTIYFKMPARNVKVTAVTTEPVPGDDDSTAASSDSGAGAIVAGTLLGGTAYLVGTHVWLNSLYGTVPTNRQQLALALWEKAGKPAPASTALFEDIRADDADAQAAARWCTEQGLVKDYGGTTFKPGRYVFRVQALKAWYNLQKLNG